MISIRILNKKEIMTYILPHSLFSNVIYIGYHKMKKINHMLSAISRKMSIIVTNILLAVHRRFTINHNVTKFIQVVASITTVSLKSKYLF
jgi:hypothetical protein